MVKLATCALAISLFTYANASEPPTHGHSRMGDAFDEGPRYHAYLMKGIPKIDFPIATTNSLAQKFFNQGVGQLHGFWYLEAERSFRQVAALDPKCAMAYWGMAKANANNEKRAKIFISKAEGLKAGAGEKHREWITCESEFASSEKPQKGKMKSYLVRLEALSKKYPNDIELKAFLALEQWEEKGISGKSTEEIDKLMNEVL